MRLHKLCSHCGTYNQMELQYDSGGWQVECLLCSNISPVKESEIPKGLNRRQYEVANTQHPMDVVTALPIPFGYYRKTLKSNLEE